MVHVINYHVWNLKNKYNSFISTLQILDHPLQINEMIFTLTMLGETEYYFEMCLLWHIIPAK